MGSNRIKQDSSINKINWEYTCDNGIRCLNIFLSESEDSSLSSTSLLTGRRLTKTSHTTSASSAMPLLGHKLRSTRVLSYQQLIKSLSYTGNRLLQKLLLISKIGTCSSKVPHLSTSEIY